jgi:Polyketide cyclase / dehydrase and lipid transport.
MRKTLVTQVSGVVEAPPDRVLARLAGIVTPTPPPAGTAHARHAPKPPRVEAIDGGVAVQGDWWYRGEWTVSPHPDGSLLVHRVYNVAQWLRWGVPLANRFFIGFRKATRASFADGLRRLAAEIGCPARLLDD